VTTELGYIYQLTNTPWDATQYRRAAEHVASETSAVLLGEPVLIYPDQFDPTIPDDMRVGVPLLRWTTTRQENG
jgi:hypothetical protein